MECFPSGASALHPGWPEAKFNVSGLFTHDPIIFGYMKFLDIAFGVRGPIDAMHGAPDVLWNGGRIARPVSDRSRLQQSIVALGQQNIGCFLTFSNNAIEDEDLADPLCNSLLAGVAARPDINGVILSSQRLSRYIAGRYPDLPQVASAVKVTIENGRGSADYYREAGKRFHRYVVHPDDGRDLPLLDQLDRDKAEILVNEPCLRDCQVRARHYELIARATREAAQLRAHVATATAATSLPPAAQALQDFGDACCESTPITKQLKAHRANCNFTPDHFKKVYDLGFRRFKLQGRSEQLFVYIYDLIRYTLEPDYAAPLMFKIICVAIETQPPKGAISAPVTTA